MDRPDVNQKSTLMNRNSGWYGTLAEIGAGQETARRLFQVGGAAGTVAKTMSAYDMRFSDAIYGQVSRYVSRERLIQMLDHEYGLLLDRLPGQRSHTRFFAFANTIAARSRSHTGPGRGWLGIRFQVKPDQAPSQIIVHVQLHDTENVQQQVALGIVGINLMYGAYALHNRPMELIDSLVDELARRRLEVDMAELSGPVAEGVDNRRISLHLVTGGLTDATMFTARGENVQPDERLHNKPVLIQRGTFRPVTVPVMQMLDEARRQWAESETPPVVINELNEPVGPEDEAEQQDLMTRIEILQKLGRNVLISNFREHFRVAQMLRRYTKAPIGMVMGAATLGRVFDPAEYPTLEGGLMEAMGRLFSPGVKFLVWPYRSQETGELVTGDNWRPPEPYARLYEYLLQTGVIRAFEAMPDADLSTFPDDVRRMIEVQEPGWEKLVPEPVREAVEKNQLAIAEQ